MPKLCSSVLDAIGATPVIALSGFADPGGPNLFGKLECTNPGGSMKDRAARGMIEWAEQHHGLKPGAQVIVAISANASFSSAASERSSLTSSEVASRTISPDRRFLPASRNSFDQR